MIIKYDIERLRTITIGRQLDGGVDIRQFDCGAWKRAYPHLTKYVLEVTAPDGTVYFPTVKMNGDILVWEVTQRDTAHAGCGCYQIVAKGEDGEQKTSDHPMLRVMGVMPGVAQEEAPEAAKSWVDSVLDAAERVENATTKPPIIGENGNWWLWDFEQEAYVDSGMLSGGYYIPTVDSNGLLTWSGSRSGMSEVEAANIKGETGDPGVYFGADQPTNEDVKIWIDPNGTVNLPTASGETKGAIKINIEQFAMNGETLQMQTDTTLEKAGMAADSKVVGEKVNDLYRKVDNIPTSSEAIVDVVSLPETDINKNVIYRLVTASVVASRTIAPSQFVCECVNELPEVGEPVTNATMDEMYLYYNLADNTVSGYVTEELATGVGISAGWYPAKTLFQVSDIPYGGVITDIKDDPGDYAIRVLISHEFYTEANGLKPLRPDLNENNPASPAYVKNRPFYETDPAYDITWDGDTTGRFMMPLDDMGAPGAYLVKVSDRIFELGDLWGSVCYGNDGSWVDLDNNNTNDSIPGVVGHDNMRMASVYDSAQVSAAMGVDFEIPTGTYFFYWPEENDWVVRLKGPTEIEPIPYKFIRAHLDDNLSAVAFSGDYNHLYNRPTVYTDVVRYGASQSLSSTDKSRARSNIDVYSKSEVDSAISTAITGAIGGSY